MADRPRTAPGLGLAAFLAGALVMAPSALGGSTGAVQVEADLISPSSGARIAAITGSVNAKGIGYASIVPLSGAAGVGMVRGEAAQMRRQPDGSMLVKGGLGTRLWLAANDRTARSAGAGRLSLALNARRTVAVAATGVTWSVPFSPRRGQRVVVVGTATGAVRNALAARYRLVRYTPGEYSRSALLANPARYRSVAGVLLGQNVTAAQMNDLDLPRSFYNSGRWVATSGSPAALDRHMYVVAHAHLGRAGVVLRRATPALGAASTQSFQLREPRIVNVRVGAARITQPARPPARTMNAMTSRARAHLARALARGERLGAQARGASEHGTATPPVVSNTTGLATMQVRVDQQINVSLSTPSWIYGLAQSMALGNVQVQSAASPVQCFSEPTPGQQVAFNFVPAAGTTCPPQTLTQVMSLTYDNLYSVSLSTGQGSGGAQQVVTEASALDVDTVANPSTTGMAAGAYQQGSGLVTPALAGQLQYYNNSNNNCSSFDRVLNGGCPWTFQTTYAQSSFSGLGLQQANHSIAVACPGSSGCRGTSGGQAQLAYSPAQSSPTTSVVQTTTNIANGTNWSLAQTSSSGWDVGGNLGFFGGTPQGGIDGGYNSSTSTTSSTGGDYTVATDFTLANWVTQPSASGNQAVYSTWSQNVPGAPAGSPAFPAGQAFSFNPQALSNTGGFVSLPAAYGSANPGPSCSSAAPAPQCTPGVQGAFGSQMNASGFQQGSVTSFTLDTPGNNSLAIGTVNPSVADSLYLWEQWINSGYCNCGPGDVPAMGGAFTQLQVLGLDTVAAAQAGGQGASATGKGSGAGLTGGITTYYGANGQVLSGVSNKSSQIVYGTLGLDLCAPPVLTSNLWAAGCNSAPGLSGPPATAAGAGPGVTAAAGVIQTGTKGQALAPAGSTLTCSPGTWSGKPTFGYQWQAWNAAVGGWAPIAGATGRTYTLPAASAPGSYVECTVTARNAAGTTQASTPSVESLGG